MRACGMFQAGVIMLQIQRIPQRQEPIHQPLVLLVAQPEPVRTQHVTRAWVGLKAVRREPGAARAAARERAHTQARVAAREQVERRGHGHLVCPDMDMAPSTCESQIK